MKKINKNKQTKEKLLEKGVELLSEQGYHGTGLKSILDKVQVPKGSFYNYFESKEKYVAEIIDKYSNDIIKRMDDYLETTGDDSITAIKTIYNTMIKEHEESGNNGCLIGNLAAEIGNRSNVCQISMQNAYGEWKKRILKLFTEAQKQGSIRNDITPEIIADIFWSAWEGGLLKMKIYNDPDYLRNLLDNLLNRLFKFQTN